MPVSTKPDPQGNAPTPQQLTGYIKETKTIEEMVGLHNAHATQMNHIHVSACWTALARLTKQETMERWLWKNTSEIKNLVQHTRRAAAAGEFGARELANIAWAFARSDQRGEALFAALARAATWRLDEFNAQDLANTA